MTQPSLRWFRTGARLIVVLIALAALGWFVVRSPDGTMPGRAGWVALRPPHDVNALLYHDGLLFAGGRDGLMALDPNNGAPGTWPDGAPEMTYVKALLVDSAGRLWAGHRTGLARLDATGWTSFALSPATPPGPVTALIETSDGQLLVGGEAGLAALSGDALVPIGLPQERAGSTVSALFEDRHGQLWVGFGQAARGGLFVRNGDGWREIGLDDGLAHLAINQISEDGDGRLLVATGFAGRGGACRLIHPDDLASWTCVTKANGLASDMVRLAQTDSHGQDWYGSEFYGAAVAVNGQITRIGLDDGLAGLELKALYEDPAGTLWLGSDKGVTRVDATATRVGP